MTADLLEGLATVEAIAKQIMSAVCAVSSDAEAFHLAVPQCGPGWHSIDCGFGDLRSHLALPLGVWQTLVYARFESNLKAPEGELGSGRVGLSRRMTC